MKRPPGASRSVWWHQPREVRRKAVDFVGVGPTFSMFAWLRERCLPNDYFCSALPLMDNEKLKSIPLRREFDNGSP